MAENSDYMNNPLVLWIETFKPPDSKALEYKDLYDGVFLNDVMQQIDQRDAYGNVQRVVEDVAVRVINWDILVKNIRAYYLEVLQQLLIWKLPNIQAICRDPEKDQSFGEVRKTLLLILGCAVQCEQKESIVENIKRLDIHVQHAIVEHIKEITDDSDAVLAIDVPENMEAYTEKMFRHISALLQERDQQIEVIQEVTQERDYYHSQSQGNPTPAPTPTPLNPEKHHLAMELAEIKTKLRHTRQELEDKLERVADLQDDLDHTKAELTKVKVENADLTQEARLTRSLRDELDIVKEKASKVDHYEKEILRYKERLNELEFYKARTEELREETAILDETRTMLEEQLATSRRRVETVVELENEMAKYRQQIEQLSAERDWDRERIELLTEENARLEFEKKTSMNESASLEQELEDARTKVCNMKGSLSDQLTETSNAKILRLELENQRLSSKLRELQEGAVIHSAEVNLQLEKENQRLVKRLEKLQESAQESRQKLLAVEEDQERVAGEKRELKQALEVVQETSERQLKELEEENAHLTHTIEVLRERNEKTNDARLKELERDNKRLTETVTAKNAQLSKMEFDSRQLTRNHAKLQEKVERVSELETENAALEKETSSLHQQVATLQLSAQRLEQLEHELSDLEVENRKLHKTAESLQSAVKRKEELEQQTIDLTVEKQKLERTLENLKASSSKVAELESDKDLLNKELQHVRKLLDTQRAQKTKQEQLEFELLDLDNENQRVQKTLEVTTRRLQQLEKDNGDLESENEQLQKQAEAWKVSSKRMEDREKQTQQLEQELERLHKDMASLEKDNRKLKQTLEVKESCLDEASTQLRTLEHDHKLAQRSVEQMKTQASRVKDLEKENKDIFTELNADRKTVATLREELVQERIRSQELSNQLEQLTQELQTVGINRQHLDMSQKSHHDSRLKALETMMQETLKKNSEIKDDKISALETRLEESKKRNMKLQDELRESRRESEVVKQRYEEEVVACQQPQHQSSAAGPRDRVVRTEVHHLQASPAAPNPTREILELKDHLVQLERTNATLLADNSNMQGSVSSLSEQCDKLERQLSSHQGHNAQLQNQTSSLQTYNAQLQVENTTLQNKCDSLGGEKKEVQTQLSNLETEHDLLIQRHEDLNSRHKALGQDHDTLQDLHRQLSLEYEALISEHGSLKSLHKALKADLKEAQQQLTDLLQGKDDMKQIREVLEKERHQLQAESRSLGNLQADYSRLSEDHDGLRQAYDRLSQDYADSLSAHKAVKSELNALQLKHTEQLAQLADAKEQLSGAVSEVQKAENRLETMYQVNERLENENQTLLLQIQQLLNQNQDLLTRALNSKDHFAEEEKQYLEKLSELRRQKERLEEKIMEHYKNRLNSPKKNKGIGAMIARKARNIISRAPRRSKSRPDLTTLNDNSSLGSGSHGDDTFSDGTKKGARSTENLNKDPGMEDDLDGGFRTLSPTPTPMPLVPRGERPRGRMSPGSEMLTLEQFLKEANKEAETSPSPQEARRLSGRRRSQDDTESRSSENSDHSSQRAAIQRLQAAAAAHHQQQQNQHPHSQHPSDLRRISSPSPNVEDRTLNPSGDMSRNCSSSGMGRDGHDPALRAASQDPNISRMSRISAGSSSGSGATTSDLSPPGPIGRVDMLVTSTPKVDGGGQRSHRGDDFRGSHGEYQDDLHKYAVPHQHSRVDGRQPSGQEAPLSPPHHLPHQHPPNTSFRLSGPEPLRSPPPPPHHNHPSLRSQNGRELPPTPTSTSADRRESLPPTDRLDRLTRGAGFESSPGGGRPGLVDPERRRSAIGEQQQQQQQRRPMPRSRSVGPQGYRGQGVGGEDGGPGGRKDRSSTLDDGSNPGGAVVSGGGGSGGGSLTSPIRRPPSSSSTTPRSYQRPASVMGHPSPSSYSTPSPSSSTHTAQRQSQQQQQLQRQSMRAEPMVGNAAPPSSSSSDRRQSTRGDDYRQHQQARGDDYGQPNFVDRPKSVPPHLFNSCPPDNNSNVTPHSHRDGPPTSSRLASRSSLEGQMSRSEAGGRDREMVGRKSLDGMSVISRVSQINNSNAASSSLSAASSAPAATPGRAGGGGGHQQGSASLPNRYSGPGTAATASAVAGTTPRNSSTGPVMNHTNPPHSSRGGPPSTPPHPHSHPYSPQSSSASLPGYGRSTTPGPRQVGSDPYGRDRDGGGPGGLEQANPYTPQRPHTAMGRPTYNSPGQQFGGRPGPGSNPNSAGPQFTPTSSRGGHPPPPPSSDHNHRPLVDGRQLHHHGSTPTPMARITPQLSKAPNSAPLPGGGMMMRGGDPSSLANQRTAVGDDPSQQNDRPKKNPVWLAR